MPVLRIVVLSLVVLVSATRAGAGPAAPGVRVTGFVREGGEPLAGAAVVAVRLDGWPEAGERLETASDERGRYVLDDVRPGSWTVFIQPPLDPGQDLGLPNFVRPGANDAVISQGHEVEVPDVEAYRHDLVYPRTVMAGRVTSDGEPVAALEVVVESFDGEEWWAMFELVTDPEGRFRARGLRSGRRYRVSAGGPFLSEDRMNRRRVHAEVELEPGTIADDLNLDLAEPGAILAGRILDVDERPPASARVHLFAPGGDKRTPPDGIAVLPDGTYRVVGLDPGPHVLVIAVSRADRRSSSEYGPFVAEDVELEAGRTAERDDRLQPDRELTVDVLWTEESREDRMPWLRIEGPGGLGLDRYFRGGSGVYGRAGWRTGVTYPRDTVRSESYFVQPGSYVVVAFKGDLEARRRVVVGEGDRLVEIDLRR